MLHRRRLIGVVVAEVEANFRLRGSTSVRSREVFGDSIQPYYTQQQPADHQHEDDELEILGRLPYVQHKRQEREAADSAVDDISPSSPESRTQPCHTQ